MRLFPSNMDATKPAYLLGFSHGVKAPQYPLKAGRVINL